MRVLLAGVVAAHEPNRPSGLAERKASLGAVAEDGPGPRQVRGVDTSRAPEGRVPGDLPQGHDDAQSREPVELPVEERRAVGQLLGGRLVARRRAAARGADERSTQREAVVAPDRARLVGQAGAVQRPVEPVARAIAGEHPPRAVRAVRRGCQAEQQDPRAAIAEPGDRLAPVDLVAEGAPALASDLAAVIDQPWAAPTGDDRPFQGLPVRGGHVPPAQ